MSLHDDYARRAPIEIAFPERTVLGELSAEVAKEAARRGVDDTSPDAFMTLVSVGEIVRSMRGHDAPPESAYALAALLFHAVHFVRAGSPLYLIDTSATRGLVSAAAGRAVPSPPSTAGYLQLPQHLVWTQAARSSPGVAGGVPESLDGIHWTLSAAGMIHVLPISGLLPDRPGFGALPLRPAPITDAHAWLDAEIRASGDDFASTLPGSELDELYSVETAGEVLKLLARFFALAEGGGARFDAHPGDSALDAGRPAGDPRPSAFAYTRISLAD
jgi:hypothetical protein